MSGGSIKSRVRFGSDGILARGGLEGSGALLLVGHLRSAQRRAWSLFDAWIWQSTD